MSLQAEGETCNGLVWQSPLFVSNSALHTLTNWMELCCGRCTARKLCSDLTHVMGPHRYQHVFLHPLGDGKQVTWTASLYAAVTLLLQLMLLPPSSGHTYPTAGATIVDAAAEYMGFSAAGAFIAAAAFPAADGSDANAGGDCDRLREHINCLYARKHLWYTAISDGLRH